MYFDCLINVDSRGGLVNSVCADTDTIYICASSYITNQSLPVVIIDPLVSGIVISCALTLPESVVPTLEAALDWCREHMLSHKVVLVANTQLYMQAIASPWLCQVTVNQQQLEKIPNAEIFPMDMLPKSYQQAPQLCPSRVTKIYDYTNVEETAYLKLIERLLTAPPRPDRTGVGTRGLFHEVLKFTLSTADGRKVMPLFTTKRVRFAAIYHELVWFLRGSTDTSYLVDNSVHIWDGNSTREYLDNYGLSHYHAGELGPIYGFQWRHAGADYTCKEIQEALDVEIAPTGIDQIERVINTLKTSPWDRRMIVCSWNVAQLAKMALPPCHYSFQFHVDPDADGNPKYLNCLVNMRSSDIFLGVPFNIASYALLTHMIADICGLTAGTLSLSMADCHLYRSHETQARELITRQPRQFPTIVFPAQSRKKLSHTIDDHAYNYKITDYTIVGYCPHASISAPMAV